MEYRRLDHRTHVLEVPDTYIGSIEPYPRKEWLLLVDNNKIVSQTVDLPNGLERLFIESLSNAVDDLNRAAASSSTASIHVHCGSSFIQVENREGKGIPLEKWEGDSSIYVPELIFGELLTSSNYTEERYFSGRNGFGVKLCNIFSSEFKVRISDGKGVIYEQTWQNNMTQKNPIQWSRISGKTERSVQITFYPEFQRFKRQGFSETDLSVFRRHVLEASLVTQKPCFFNGTEFSGTTLLSYAERYVDYPLTTSIEAGNGILLTDQVGLCVSFVNGIRTVNDGVHVDSLVKELKTALNITTKKVFSTAVKAKFGLFLNCKVKNPKFNSQTKERLVGPSDIETPLRTKELRSWPYFTEVKASLEQSKVPKTAAASHKLQIKDLDDANWAGKYPEKCTLLLTEGKSAMSYAMKAISFHSTRDKYGVFPLRGKVLNVVDDKSTNREIGLVEKALGLPQGPLRYGRVIVLADSDLDGKHILALILNWFATKYPHLLKRTPSFLGFLRTPIVKATKGHEKKNFYSEEEFRRCELRGYKVRYLKGLGSSSDQDIREDFSEDRFEFFSISNDQDVRIIEEAFRKTQVAARKDWILNSISTESRPDSVISRFIQEELVEYSKETISRSIPSFFDGLKESQRKVLWSSFHFADKTAVKVAQLSAHAAKITHYKHGEGCLSDVITRLAQDFVGSNNLSFFEPHGQPGSRYSGGTDAASDRYLYVKLKKVVPYIFPAEDDFQLPSKVEDGEEVEPEHLLPIIPLALVNGASGIATGFKTWIPPHDPLAVIEVTKKLLLSQPIEPGELLPKWLGFVGKIVVHPEYVDTYGIINEATMTVKELPIGFWTSSFRELLDQLIADKKLSNYVNHSKHNTIHFELQNLCVSVDDLHLKKRWSLKNLYLSQGKTPRQFNSCFHILSQFVQWRRSFYESRKQKMVKDIEDKQKKEKERIRAIQAVLEGHLPFRGEKRDIEKALTKLKITREQLKEISMDDLFEDKVQESISKVNKLQQDLEILSAKTPNEMYLEDLEKLKVHLQ
ncbi:hypothetical protein GpartN1_g1915.t1 [Galdieria partita]|uniref:DNA topoisomerase 2 n=1 Tax=Galdieria partita TaxID=83374 RepID=A0A9C7PTG9_9RHOD|nr:hypothetical protein GpartN1_g1915.t1 [Galdieria partita]